MVWLFAVLNVHYSEYNSSPGQFMSANGVINLDNLLLKMAVGPLPYLVMGLTAALLSHWGPNPITGIPGAAKAFLPPLPKDWGFAAMTPGPRTTRSETRTPPERHTTTRTTRETGPEEEKDKALQADARRYERQPASTHMTLSEQDAAMVTAARDPISITGNLSLIAYDCDHPATRTVPVDLGKTGSCEEPEHDYHDPVLLTAAVIHSKPHIRVRAYRCRILETNVVAPCHRGIRAFGYWAGTSPHYRRLNQPVRLNKEECLAAVQQGYYFHRDNEDTHFNFDYRNGAFTVGKGLVHEYYAAGSRDHESGHCKADGQVNGTDQYAQPMTMSGVSAWVKRQLLFTEMEGYYDQRWHRYHFGHDIVAPGRQTTEWYDEEFGLLVWDRSPTSCDGIPAQIYAGDALMYRGKVRGQSDILMVESATTNQTLGLELLEPVQICNQTVQCYTTNLEEVITCLGPAARSMLQKELNTEVVINGLTRIGTLAGIHFHTLQLQFNIEERFRIILRELCRLSKDIMTTRLRMLGDGRHNDMALFDYFGPGHTYTQMGGAVYIGECVAVVVHYRPIQNCSQEIPVWHRNEKWFAHALTRILQPAGSSTPCSGITPPTYEIGGAWYCAEPSLHPCDEPPIQLKPLTTGFNLRSYSDGMRTQAFTPAQVRAHQALMHETQTREAVVSAMTHEASQYASVTSNHTDLGFTFPSPMSILAQMLPTAFLASAWGWLIRLALWVMAALASGLVAKIVFTACCRLLTARNYRAGWIVAFLGLFSSTVMGAITAGLATATTTWGFLKELFCRPRVRDTTTKETENDGREQSSSPSAPRYERIPLEEPNTDATIMSINVRQPDPRVSTGERPPSPTDMPIPGLATFPMPRRGRSAPPPSTGTRPKAPVPLKPWGEDEEDIYLRPKAARVVYPSLRQGHVSLPHCC